MSLVTAARMNSRITNSYPLRAAAFIRPIQAQVEAHEANLRHRAEAKAKGLNPNLTAYVSPANWEVVGECGHRLEVVAHSRLDQRDAWSDRIAQAKRHRRRCFECA